MILGWLWATKTSVLAEMDWLEVMTAFGTAESAAAATYFGTRDGRRLRREKVSVAQLMAVRVAAKIALLSGELTALRRHVDQPHLISDD